MLLVLWSRVGSEFVLFSNIVDFWILFCICIRSLCSTLFTCIDYVHFSLPTCSPSPVSQSIYSPALPLVFVEEAVVVLCCFLVSVWGFFVMPRLLDLSVLTFCNQKIKRLHFVIFARPSIAFGTPTPHNLKLSG